MTNNVDKKYLSYQPHSEKDVELRVKWLNNPLVKKYVYSEGKDDTTLEDQKQWFENYRKSNNKKMFLVSYQSTPIGLVGLTDIDDKQKKANIFIMIGEDKFRGKGLASEIIQHIINYASNDLLLETLIAEVIVSNAPAIKLYEKNNFKKDSQLSSAPEYLMIFKKTDL